MIEVVATFDAVEIDVDDMVDEATGIRYIGFARRVDDRWQCLAQVGSALCLVEVRVRPTIVIDHDRGDEDNACTRRFR